MPVDKLMLQKALYGRFGPGGELHLACAPGRINLLGEHTDYNGGYVLPCAINREVTFLFRANHLGKLRLVSLDLRQSGEAEMNDPPQGSGPQWVRRVLGVVAGLRQAEPERELVGIDAAIAGEVPQGAGLSSSAAYSTAALLALDHAAGLGLDPVAGAQLCQRAEYLAAGVRCGIMDPFVSRLARSGHALFIDCQDLTCEHLPLDGDRAAIVAVDSGLQHELAASAYNERRATCEAAAVKLGGEGATLRSLSLEQLQHAGKRLSPLELKRLRHVVSENLRVSLACGALKANNLEAFGKLMLDSHLSLKHDYEVSCRELDLLVEIALESDGCLGARLTGGGFGGCTVNLVRPQAVNSFLARMLAFYGKHADRPVQAWVFKPAPGARLETFD